MSKKPPYVIKADGDKVPFSRNSLFTSLIRSGASKNVANSVTDKVSATIKNGISTTHDIYANAHTLLRDMEEKSVAGRYSLKRAIIELGPTGFPFEVFLSEILKRHKYQTRVGVIVDGACVPHEVDVIAIKNDIHVLIEAKFHNQPGMRTDVKVPLYIQARFQDIKKQLKQDGDNHKKHESWIITNTRFTSSAIEYGECMGMTLIGWRYPESGGLEKIIESEGLHPITCLPSLSKKEKDILLKRKIVLCKDIIENPNKLSFLGLSKQKISYILCEAKKMSFII